MFNFGDKQAEIVLHATLHTDGADSPDFDAARDQTGIGEEARDETFSKLIENGVHFGVPTWSSEEGASGPRQRASEISREACTADRVRGRATKEAPTRRPRSAGFRIFAGFAVSCAKKYCVERGAIEGRTSC
ncbi:hypothetical protein NLM33_34975 [Bradyrhizobium sp. CCGUVB1N3]|uniref:hypothetical protein n=1 Tax=Bradyrhizobium sp. CCGUVB1N3 TaxID=2949629 RepID=UPI0020B3E83C|nr:hypothetical protein [Bradyrhizobium sp. CCGUVB1N3]MCP3475499.1 hypothetical protein [Bradyrhizobium sp. CCGUVB1N3]